MGTLDHYKQATSRAADVQPNNRTIKVDHTGKRFGQLTVVGLAPTRQQPNGRWITYWECKCDCGEKREIKGGNLTTGKTKSCGCLRLKKVAAMKTPLILFYAWLFY